MIRLGLLSAIALLSAAPTLPAPQVAREQTMLVGVWQRGHGDIASGLSDVYRFWPDGRFSFHFSEMDCAKREVSYSGHWQLDRQRLSLQVEERRILMGGRLEPASSSCSGETELVRAAPRTRRLRPPEVLTLDIGSVEEVRTDRRGAITAQGDLMSRVVIGGDAYWRLSADPSAQPGARR